eukprot:g5703.t1
MAFEELPSVEFHPKEWFDNTKTKLMNNKIFRKYGVPGLVLYLGGKVGFYTFVFVQGTSHAVHVLNPLPARAAAGGAEEEDDDDDEEEEDAEEEEEEGYVSS